MSNIEQPEESLITVSKRTKQKSVDSNKAILVDAIKLLDHGFEVSIFPLENKAGNLVITIEVSDEDSVQGSIMDNVEFDDCQSLVNFLRVVMSETGQDIILKSKDGEDGCIEINIYNNEDGSIGINISNNEDKATSIH